MSCARQGCDCTVGAARFEHEGRIYCCEKCAKVCTDGNCQCMPSDTGAS